MNKIGKIKGLSIAAVLLLAACISGCSDPEQAPEVEGSAEAHAADTLAEIPEYSGEPMLRSMTTSRSSRITS